jgi:hypothetical protein
VEASLAEWSDEDTRRGASANDKDERLYGCIERMNKF